MQVDTRDRGLQVRDNCKFMHDGVVKALAAPKVKAKPAAKPNAKEKPKKAKKEKSSSSSSSSES